MYSKITISGKICAGKSSVFRELQKELNWPTFSSGSYFREYAKTHNLILNNAEEQTNKLTYEVDGKVREMLNNPGNLLLDAWLGGILAEGNPQVLRVLLVADDVIRFRRFAEREHLSLEESQKEVMLRDTSWFEKVKKIHGRSDFFDEKNYDVIIDTSLVTVEQVVSLILNTLSASQPATSFKTS